MNVLDVVVPGQVWESRDSRDLGRGPAGHARQVRVIQVHDGIVHVENVVTGRETHIRLEIFASRRRRGGFRRVTGSPSAELKYEYRIVSPASYGTRITLSKLMLENGWRLVRRQQGSNSVWEDVT